MIDGNVISVTPWNLRGLIHLEPLPAHKCDLFVKMAFGRRVGHRVPARHLLEKVFGEPFVGAGGLLASDDDLRNSRWARFDRINQDNESFHVRGGEYVTPSMFTLPVKVSACFRRLVLCIEHIDVHETVTATEQVRDETGVQALADAARAHRDEGAHDADASQCRAY